MGLPVSETEDFPAGLVALGGGGTPSEMNPCEDMSKASGDVGRVILGPVDELSWSSSFLQRKLLFGCGMFSSSARATNLEEASEMGGGGGDFMDRFMAMLSLFMGLFSSLGGVGNVSMVPRTVGMSVLASTSTLGILKLDPEFNSNRRGTVFLRLLMDPTSDADDVLATWAVDGFVARPVAAAANRDKSLK